MQSTARLLAIAAVIALVGVGIWLTLGRPHRQTNANSAAASRYSNPSVGFSVVLPQGWATVNDSSFKGDAVFQSADAQRCGCAVYVTKETNPDQLGVEAWLAQSLARKDTYLSQDEYTRRATSSDPATKALAGTYSQEASTLGGASGIKQQYQGEGGGYVRYLVPRGSSVYALTLWSDAFYFTDSAKQSRFDGGQLKRAVEEMVTSFSFNS